MSLTIYFLASSASARGAVVGGDIDSARGCGVLEPKASTHQSGRQALKLIRKSPSNPRFISEMAGPSVMAKRRQRGFAE
jgi:hypothetical protein